MYGVTPKKCPIKILSSNMLQKSNFTFQHVFQNEHFKPVSSGHLKLRHSSLMIPFQNRRSLKYASKMRGFLCINVSLITADLQVRTLCVCALFFAILKCQRGIILVSRRNRLEMLIPKHMLKSKIGLL